MSAVVSRRVVIGGATAGLGLAAWPALAALEPWPARLVVRSGSARDYGPAIAAIRRYAQAELAAIGLPGMTMAIADDEGFAATLSLGWADVAARVPVRPDHLFEIGSISKSLVALTLWGMAEAGRLDLSAPLARYLPDLPLPAEPIAVQQVLNHVAGLPNGAPPFPRVPGGRLWTGAKPGSRFHYSNTGYELLGYLIAAIAGRPHPAAIEANTLAPIGMAGARAAIRDRDRARYATGYIPLLGEGTVSGAALVEGEWGEVDMAAGAIVASAEQMVPYLRYVLALGQGRGGPILPDAAAGRLLATADDAPELGKGVRYASGFELVEVGGRPALHHTGGMLLFSSAFHADPAAGVACFASVNGRLAGYRPKLTTAWAIQLLRAAKAGRPLPVPPPPDFATVDKPDRHVGKWIAAGGETMEIRRDAGGLALVADGATGRLEGDGDTLVTDHAVRFSHLLQFEGKERFDRLWWGETSYGRDAAPPALPPLPPALAPLAGTYAGATGWVGRTSILARGDRLVMEGAGPLTRQPAGHWTLPKDDGGLERIRFEDMLNGRPHRLSLSGSDLIRQS